VQNVLLSLVHAAAPVYDPSNPFELNLPLSEAGFDAVCNLSRNIPDAEWPHLWLTSEAQWCQETTQLLARRGSERGCPSNLCATSALTLPQHTPVSEVLARHAGARSLDQLGKDAEVLFLHAHDVWEELHRLITDTALPHHPDQYTRVAVVGHELLLQALGVAICHGDPLGVDGSVFYRSVLPRLDLYQVRLANWFPVHVSTKVWNRHCALAA